MNTAEHVERWGRFEIRLDGPRTGNPFSDVSVKGIFKHNHRKVEAEGFYDGDGVYRIRFMPDETGEWNYETVSNAPELDGHAGSFDCTEPSPGNHGPVRVHDTFHFAHADGTPFRPFGTTCYVWNHQGEEREAETLASLKDSPFNKIRMCVFPKHYDYNEHEPPLYPFEGTPWTGWDFSRFHPPFWTHLEKCIEQLQKLGIEADLILFHPYDRWGFSSMDPEADDRYLRYVTARLSSFRNIWWSLANEYDLLKAKTMRDWDRFFRIIQEHDPYGHLRSIHNWHHPGIHYRNNAHWYDHGKPWVTHLSIQHHDMFIVPEWRDRYRKPVIIDECRYEGNLHHGWGNITAEKMTDLFWAGMLRGGYVTHGETYVHPQNILWWSHGGKLHGYSPSRIAFLKKLIEEAPADGWTPLDFHWDAAAGGVNGQYYLVYFGADQPLFRELDLPDDVDFHVEWIDAMEMKITPLKGTYSGKCRVDLPGKPYTALRIRRI